MPPLRRVTYGRRLRRTLASNRDMTKESKIEIAESEKTRFCEGLRGRVFHVTCASNLDKIKNAGEILVNVDCNLTTTFGNSENSFYRLRGCVSVFDYESPTDEKWREYMWKCDPLGARKDDLAFLFLSEEAKNNLIRWSKASLDWDTERVVPHIEAGYMGNIPLSSISEILVVKVIIDTESLAYRLNQARDNAKMNNET